MYCYTPNRNTSGSSGEQEIEVGTRAQKACASFDPCSFECLQTSTSVIYNVHNAGTQGKKCFQLKKKELVEN